MAWTDEQKEQVIAAYKDGEPTPGNSTELIKQIAEQWEASPNGVRMILVQAGVYVKKDAVVAAADKKAAGVAGDKAPRVSKESQITALKELLEAKGAEIDNDILDKLTGKAAAYFAKVLA